MRSTRLPSLVAFLLLSGVNMAMAHAFPKTEEPAGGATLKEAPSIVSITFAESIDARFSGIIVENAEGVRADDGSARRDPDNDRRLSVTLKQPVAAGSYKVTWHAFSTDGHRTEGSYRFSVTH